MESDFLFHFWLSMFWYQMNAVALPVHLFFLRAAESLWRFIKILLSAHVIIIIIII